MCNDFLKTPKRFSIIYDITPEIEKCAEGVGSKCGTGGMITKLKAAKIAIYAGANVVIVNGENPSVIFDVLDGKDVGTLFPAKRGNRK